MGKEIARLLAARGANVILVARTVKNLESAVEHAKAHAKNSATQRFTFISADVSSESENARVLAEATAWNNGKSPEIVWCVAGVSTPGLFVETSTDTLRKQMELNYFAPLYLAHQTLQTWFYPKVPYAAASQSKGTVPELPRHFIVTSSVAAMFGTISYTPYAPAKAALRALADGLRSEVQLYNAARRSKNQSSGQAPAPFDVQIHAIIPGTILSPGYENEEKTKHPVLNDIEKTDPKQTELEAATAAIKGLERGNFMTPTNWLAYFLCWGMLGNSERSNVLLDLVGQWLTTLVWLVMIPDLNGKVWAWGKKHGMPVFRRNAQ